MYLNENKNVKATRSFKEVHSEEHNCFLSF